MALRRRIAVTGLSLAIAAASFASAAERKSEDEHQTDDPITHEAVKDELDQIRKNLGEQSALERDRSEKASKLLAEVRALDERLLASARKRDALKLEEKELEAQYADRLESLEEIEKDYDKARGRLSRRLSSLYKRGRLGSTRVLAHAAASTEPLRMARYLAAISKADSAAIDDFERLKYRHEGALRELGAKKKEIAGKHAALNDEAERYESVRGEKGELLASIEKDLHAQQSTLGRLKATEGELQRLLASIPPPPPIIEAEEEATVEVDEPPQGPAVHDGDEEARAGAAEGPPQRLARLFQAERPGAPFKDRRGDLEVPVRGDVIARFSEARDSAPRVQGLLLRANRDHQVVAVARGEVVFSGPFPGLGKTLIINHGSRYHTVYAHLDSIYQEVGARVRENEVIGTLGTAQPTLHFELRKEGKALDPVDWFRGGLAAFRP